ncbi:hypothetical protein GFL15_25630 [Rhizobium leguminosarum bv. viciae]|nr:hypothetical protein [Rhizobium leguminosarum bv. viciae]
MYAKYHSRSCRCRSVNGEGYALKYFVLYALVCSAVGVILLVVIHEIAPSKIGQPSNQTTGWSADEAATAPAGQPDDLVVRSTPEPAPDHPAVRPPDQWDLRPTNAPEVGQPDQSGVRKGGRVGTPP